MPKIQEGDTFPTLQDFKESLRKWAIEENWTPHILDSDSHRVRAGCRSAPNCPFRIRANHNANRGNVLVTTCDGEHTCFQSRDNANPLHQNIKRSETGKLKFLLEAVPKLMTVTLTTHVQEIVDAVENKYGQKIPIRQAQKVKNGLTPRVLGPCRHCRRTGHTRRHCPHLKHMGTERNSSFSVNEPADTTMGDPGSEGSTYADGGLEREYETNASLLSHPPGNTTGSQQPSQGGNRSVQASTFGLESSLSNGVYPADARQRAFPETTAQSRQASTPIMTRTAGQTRLEASRLMQQAAKLMEQAARLNSEAARLNASVANL